MGFRIYDCCVTYNNWRNATHIHVHVFHIYRGISISSLCIVYLLLFFFVVHSHSLTKVVPGVHWQVVVSTLCLPLCWLSCSFWGGSSAGGWRTSLYSTSSTLESHWTWVVLVSPVWLTYCSCLRSHKLYRSVQVYIAVSWCALFRVMTLTATLLLAPTIYLLWDPSALCGFCHSI